MAEHAGRRFACPAAGRRLAGAARRRKGLMKRHSTGAMALILLALLLAGALWPAAGAAQSSGAITVSKNEAQVTFSSEVRYHLAARSNAAIKDIVLFYRLAGSNVTTRAYPEFKSAASVDATYTWELENGDLAPGTEISYYWEIEDAAGAKLRTPSQSVVYNDDRFEWKETRQGQVRLFAYGSMTGRAGDLAKVAQAAIDKLQTDIGVVLQQPIRIYVYANRNDMLKAIPSRSERYDQMTTTLGVTMSADTLVLLGNASGVNATVAHELSHIVVGLAVKSPLGRLPRWLDEGLAMYAEGSLPANNKSALDRAVRNDQLISVRSLSGYSGDPDMVDLFYAESYSLVSFLLKTYGREKMLELLSEFKRGAYQDDALLKVYGVGIDELDNRWRASLGLGPRKPATPVATRQPAGSSQPAGAPNSYCASMLPGLVIVGLFLLRPRRAR